VIREQELAAACDVLGIQPPWIMNFPDRGLERLEEETLLRPFVRAMRTIRPDVVISFHADGISGHPDHRTVTERARRAFHVADDGERWPDLGPPHAALRFWAYSVPESRARLITTRKLFAVPDEELDAVIDISEFMETKRAAVNAHATQKLFIENMEKQLGDMKGFWGKESFVLAEARVPLPEGAQRPVTDLFAGMDAG
jgi:LmbE family N-acetylglucosaminyl deacetylase